MKRIILFTILSIFCLCINLHAKWESVLFATNVYNITTYNNIVYTGTDYGVFFSYNNGIIWIEKDKNLTKQIINSFAVIGNNIFAGSYDYGILHSTENGDNWIEKNTGLTNTAVLALASIDSTLFAGTNGGGIFKSTDFGNSWNCCINNLSAISVQTIFVIGNDIFIGTYDRGVFKSTDFGNTWTEKNNGLNNIRVFSLFYNKGYLCAGIWNGGVFISSDYGDSWNDINKDLPDKAIQSVIKIGNSIIVGTKSSGVYLTSDFGNNWNDITDGIPSDIKTLAFNDNYIYAGAKWKGIYRRLITDFGIDNVPENTKESSFSIFPNPATDLLQIKYPGEINSIKIINELGIAVETGVEAGLRPVSTKNGFYDIDIHNFPIGTYFCIINSGKNTETKKFIVVR